MEERLRREKGAQEGGGGKMEEGCRREEGHRMGAAQYGGGGFAGGRRRPDGTWSGSYSVQGCVLGDGGGGGGHTLMHLSQGSSFAQRTEEPFDKGLRAAHRPPPRCCPAGLPVAQDAAFSVSLAPLTTS